MPGASMGSDALSIKLANDKCGIREVWASNLEKEFKAMRQVVQKYPFVAMVSCSCYRIPTQILTLLYLSGHRVPRSGCEAHWGIPELRRLSVSTTSLQCRSAQVDSSWCHIHE